MLLTLLLQASAANNYSSLLLPVILGLVMYFFMIRPQQRRAADAKKLRENLLEGSRVVTIGGLHGRIVELTPETVVLEVERGTRLRFDRSAIARQVGNTAAPTPAP